MSSGERAIRHGELRQLKEMKRAHKFEAPQKRKLLKSDTWGLEDNVEEDQSVDIRDVDFRLSHDPSKINVLGHSRLFKKIYCKLLILTFIHVEFSFRSNCL